MLQNLVEQIVEGAAGRGLRGRVLNATSGSAASANATAAAAVIATERDMELIVVHVRAPEVMRVGRLAPTIVHQQRLDDPHGNGVLSTARQVAWAHGALARLVLITGDPGPAIVSLAAELDVELVVIGATPSHVPAAIAGRTRYRIQRDSRCPVRVVVLSEPPRPRQLDRCLRRERVSGDRSWLLLTVFGACVVTFMMVMYALEGRSRRFVLAFAAGCALSSTYGFLAGTWPFGIVEGTWSLVAVKRFVDQRAAAGVASRSAAASAASASARAGSSIPIESRRAEAS